MKYSIIRFYSKVNKQARVIKTGLTLKEVKKHCNDPATEKKGEWFDGYAKEPNQLN